MVINGIVINDWIWWLPLINYIYIPFIYHLYTHLNYIAIFACQALPVLLWSLLRFCPYEALPVISRLGGAKRGPIASWAGELGDSGCSFGPSSDPSSDPGPISGFWRDTALREPILWGTQPGANPSPQYVDSCTLTKTYQVTYRS